MSVPVSQFFVIAQPKTILMQGGVSVMSLSADSIWSRKFHYENSNSLAVLLKFVGLQAINAPSDICAEPQNSAGNACVPSTNVSLRTLPLQASESELL